MVTTISALLKKKIEIGKFTEVELSGSMREMELRYHQG
jgi:hypothetical protein